MYFTIWYNPLFNFVLQRGTRGGGMSDTIAGMEGGMDPRMDGTSSSVFFRTSGFDPWDHFWEVWLDWKDLRIWDSLILERDVSSNSVGVSQSLSRREVELLSKAIRKIVCSRSTVFSNEIDSLIEAKEGTILKWSSNTKYYYQEICVVLRLRINGTSLECVELKPTNVPWRERDYHLSYFSSLKC